MYYITFEANGGYFNDNRQTTSLKYTAEDFTDINTYLFTAIGINIKKDGYKFAGWKVKEGSLTITGYEIYASSDGTVEAIWEPINIYYTKTANGWVECEIYCKQNLDNSWVAVDISKKTENGWS